MTVRFRYLLAVGCAVTFAAGPAFAQNADWSVAVKAHGGVTTTARLVPRPDAPTAGERAATDAFDRFLSGGIEVRLPLFDGGFYLSASGEYGTSIQSRKRPYAFPDTLHLVPVEEGIRFIPVEVGIHAVIPLGSETIRMAMGGGVGIYYAARVLRIAGETSRIVNSPLDLNVFVGITVGYRLSPSIVLEGDVIFRDPETTCENRFDGRSVTVDGITGPLPSRTLPSRVTVDGMRLSLGLVYEVW